MLSTTLQEAAGHGGDQEECKVYHRLLRTTKPSTICLSTEREVKKPKKQRGNLLGIRPLLYRFRNDAHSSHRNVL